MNLFDYKLKLMVKKMPTYESIRRDEENFIHSKSPVLKYQAFRRIKEFSILEALIGGKNYMFNKAWNMSIYPPKAVSEFVDNRQRVIQYLEQLPNNIRENSVIQIQRI